MLEHWTSVHHVKIVRNRDGNVKTLGRGVLVAAGDSLDTVLAAAQSIVDEDAAEIGPGRYTAQFRAEDDRALASMTMVGGDLPEEGTVESEQLKTIKAQAAAFTSMSKAVSEREAASAKAATEQANAVGSMFGTFVKMMEAAATGTAATASATVECARLQFDDARDRRDREDDRSAKEADAKNMADALKVGQSIASPLVGLYAEHLKEELAEKREEKRREKAKKRAAEERERAAEEAAAEPAPSPKKKRGKKKPEPKIRTPKAKRAKATPTPEPAPSPPPAPERRPSAGLAADAAAFLESLSEDDGDTDGEKTRMFEIVGEDLWSCLVACAKASDDDHAKAIMAKAVEIVEGPLIQDGRGARQTSKGMPKAERERLERELAELLGISRGLQLKALLAKGGVRL